MPSAAEMERIKADPARLANYQTKRAADRKRWKAANREKVLKSQSEYRERNRERLYASKNLYRAALREIKAADAAASRQSQTLDHARQLAIYERALRLLPLTIPPEIRRSYAAAALVAVADGDLPANFKLADLQPIRWEDLPMDASGRIIFLGAVTEDDTGMLAGLY